MVNSSDVSWRTLTDGIAAMFRKVDQSLGDQIEKTTENKIKTGDKHPHKTAWH